MPWETSAGWPRCERFLLEPSALIALAVALRRERVGALLLLVFGLLKLAMLFFPVDALGAPVISAGQMHNLFGTLTFFLFPVAALVLFLLLRRRGSRLAPLVAVALAITTAGVLAAASVGGSA